MFKGLLELSKQNQKLYERFLENENSRNGNIYKARKYLFEILKEKCKKNIIETVFKNIKIIYRKCGMGLRKSKVIKGQYFLTLTLQQSVTFY